MFKLFFDGRFPRRLGLLVLCLLLAGCGFKLRGAMELPPEMQRVALEGVSPASPIAQALRSLLRFSGGTIAADRAAADSILRITHVEEERREVSLTETGKANEFELTYRVSFDVITPQGAVLLPEQTVEIVRDYFNDQLNIVGKTEEEILLWQEMQKEAARTLLRRVDAALSSRASLRSLCA